VNQDNLLPLPPGRTLLFEKNEADTEGSFIARSAGETSVLQILQWEWTI
jgi:hypothetical protein